MQIEFDPEKDVGNIVKHGVSLARAGEMQAMIVVEDPRFTGEQRYRISGLLDDRPHCLAAVLRDGVVRAISLRRAHQKEYGRYV